SGKPASVLPSSSRPGSETMIDLAVVFDGEQRFIFRDGKRVHNADIAFGGGGEPKDKTTATRIGASVSRDATSGYGYRGFIQHLRISKTARYRTTYDPPKVLEADADTMLLYRFDQSTGTVAKDLSSNKLDGQ